MFRIVLRGSIDLYTYTPLLISSQERDEAATIVADVIGVVGAASDAKDLIARAQKRADGAPAAAVAEIAASEPSTGADSNFIGKIRLACCGGDGRAVLDATIAGHADALDGVAEAGIR